MKWISLLVCLCASIALGGTRDANKPDQEHLDYGAKFNYVVRLRTKQEATGRNQYSSGVLISKRHVLTAAHVIEGTNEWGVVSAKNEVGCKDAVMHPEYDSKKFGFNDIALVTLSEAILLDFYPELYDAEDEVGKVVSICGYGITGTFSMATTSLTSDGRRRAGSNIIEKIDPGMLVCSIGGSPRTALEFCITPGDSGGGLFIGNKLAGINSLVYTDNGPLRYGYGSHSGHTRVVLHKKWILEQMQNDE